MKKILISVVLLALALPVSALNVVSIADNITVSPGNSTRVPVYLNGSTNVAGATIRLDYIPSVVMAYSDGPTLDKGDFTDFYAADNSNNASGFIIINTYKTGAGLNGNVTIGYVRLKAVGSPGNSSQLNLTIIGMFDSVGGDVTPGGVVNGSFIISDITPPVVTNPNATPPIIANDGSTTSRLNITVTDETSLTVRINLSAISGSASQLMTQIPGTNIWTYVTNAIATPGNYNLQVNATDAWGNSNTSVAIPIRVISPAVISIGNVSAAPGGSVVTPIRIINSPGIAGIVVRLSYNASVVNATNATQGNFTSYFAFDGSTASSGYVTINTYINGTNLSGNVGVANLTLKAVGSGGDTSSLNLTVLSLTDQYGNEIPRTISNGSFAILADTTPPVVTNPSVNQSDIPDDTDGVPLWGETAQLNVTVTDNTGIASVTINLSAIGGPSNKAMTPLGGNLYSTTTNASAGTPPKIYNLTVNATDASGNSNTSVTIPLKVMKNGDVTGNGAVNIGDAILLANNISFPGNPTYALSSIYVADVTGDGNINLGDALRLANNVSSIGNPAYILK